MTPPPSPPRVAEMHVLWTLPPVDPAYLRRVVADVRARLAARASRAPR